MELIVKLIEWLKSVMALFKAFGAGFDEENGTYGFENDGAAL